MIAWATLADIYLRARNVDQALIYLKRVTELMPNELAILNSYAANCLTVGKFKEGIEAFKK
ncbi:tetratricopeptide repeat protein [Brasilonema sp. CT11]|nr:tetratricopeptide repeat protein [Brasilonema sp. CT11]